MEHPFWKKIPKFLVEMRGITKRFPGVIANEEVTFSVRPGEVHALLGENGAGKSTLMNVLTGLYRPDEGQILWKGEPVDIGSPRDALDLGIGMVHQHFMLVKPLSVAENVILGSSRGGFALDLNQVAAEVEALGERYGLRVDPYAPIWQLTVGEQQRVEILKLLYRGAELLVLDEPTAVLTPQEADELGETMRQMASEEKGVVFITHKLDEVMRFADRVTVLRGGKVIGTVLTAVTSKAELAREMVGREVLFRVEKEPVDPGAVILSVRNVSAENNKGLPALRDVSFDLRRREILGVAGVAGNGQQELSEVITGLRPVTEGQIWIGSRNITNRAPLTTIRAGVSHIPADRVGMGVAGNMTVAENLIMKGYRKRPIAFGGFLSLHAIREYAGRLIDAFRIATPGLSTPIRMLSGGNLQKAILAREIDAHHDLLVAVHPTRGLDVGATETVQCHLLEQRQQGTAILLISEDLDELLALSDRIAVLYEGRIMDIVDTRDADVERIGLMMAGEATTE